MPDGVSANKMADFFGQVLGVVASSFQRLSHEYDFQAGMARDIFGVFDVAKKNQIAQAVDFGVGSQHVNSFFEVPGRGSPVLFHARGEY